MRFHCAFAIAFVSCLPALMAAWGRQDPPTKVSPLVAPSDVAAPAADAEKTPSGLASKVVQPGKETIHPKAADTVTVHYTGWTTDGKMFDSSWARQKPASFKVGGVIPGFSEGLQLM